MFHLLRNNLKANADDLEKKSWYNYFHSHKSIKHRQTSSRKNISKVEIKIPNTSTLVTIAILNKIQWSWEENSG